MNDTNLLPNMKLNYLNAIHRECYRALADQNFDHAKELIKQGIDLSYESHYFLNHFVFCKKIEQIKFLIEHGEDIHYDNNKIIDISITRGFLPVVQFLIEQKIINIDYVINTIEAFNKEENHHFDNKHVHQWAILYKRTVELKNKIEQNLKTSTNNDSFIKKNKI